MTRPQHLDLSSKLTHLAFHPRSLPTEKPQTSHVTPARDQTGHGEQLPYFSLLILGSCSGCPRGRSMTPNPNLECSNWPQRTVSGYARRPNQRLEQPDVPPKKWTRG